jgi:hypothetical protein
MRKSVISALAALVGLAGCKDIDRFTTDPDESYCGKIVSASIVRRGFSTSVCMRLTFDAQHVNDKPGSLWTDDGMFTATPLRSIPELSNDPLLTLNFGEGREKNLLYAIDPVDPERGPAVTAVVSLMHSGETEVRLFRGAAGGPDPAASPDGGPHLDGPPLFGVFAPLRRREGTCSAETDCAWAREN